MALDQSFVEVHKSMQDKITDMCRDFSHGGVGVDYFEGPCNSQTWREFWRQNQNEKRKIKWIRWWIASDLKKTQKILDKILKRIVLVKSARSTEEIKLSSSDARFVSKNPIFHRDLKILKIIIFG